MSELALKSDTWMYDFGSHVTEVGPVVWLRLEGQKTSALSDKAGGTV